MAIIYSKQSVLCIFLSSFIGAKASVAFYQLTRRWQRLLEITVLLKTYLGLLSSDVTLSVILVQTTLKSEIGSITGFCFVLVFALSLSVSQHFEYRAFLPHSLPAPELTRITLLSCLSIHVNHSRAGFTCSAECTDNNKVALFQWTLCTTWGRDYSWAFLSFYCKSSGESCCHTSYSIYFHNSS